MDLVAIKRTIRIRSKPPTRRPTHTPLPIDGPWQYLQEYWALVERPGRHPGVCVDFDARHWRGCFLIGDLLCQARNQTVYRATEEERSFGMALVVADSLETVRGRLSSLGSDPSMCMSRRASARAFCCLIG